MSKTYKCEGCKRETSSVSDWLSISADENMLHLENNLPERKLIKLSNFTQIDFCSMKCFITTLFTEESLKELCK